MKEFFSSAKETEKTKSKERLVNEHGQRRNTVLVNQNHQISKLYRTYATNRCELARLMKISLGSA